MKKLFNLFICLLLCFGFINYVHAEDDVNSGEEYSEIDEEDYEDEDDAYSDVDDEYYDDEYYDDEVMSNEEILEEDANVENSQTSDIPIMLIAFVAIISLVIVLSKKNIFVNSGY